VIVFFTKVSENFINIIGAGPAGLTAAIVLRKHGFPVRVYEKAAGVGHRLNGDFQGLENWSSEKDITEIINEKGIEINFLCAPCYGGTVYAPEMRPVEITSDRPIFYLVTRGPMAGSLDAGLKEQALSLGAEILFDRRPDGIDGKTIVGTGPRGAVGIIRGIVFNTSRMDMVAVVFNDEIAPAGYAYLIVNQGRGTMVTVLYREFKSIDRYFDRMALFFIKNIKIDIRDEKNFGGFGDFFIADTQVRNRKLYIGEAGGFQDYLWGFGMRYAIVSGSLAARSIIEGADYDDFWKQELKPMMETSLVNRYLYEKFGHTVYRYIAKKTAKGNPCDFLRRHYNPSPVKGLFLYAAKKRFDGRISSKTARKDIQTMFK
jgi:flavin-dependent dehydrogenase